MDTDTKQDWLAAYDRVVDIYKLNLDNYFKRTQILMVAIQLVLFVAFTRFLTVSDDTFERVWYITFVFPLLGMFASLAWWVLIKRQRQRLELCKYYMRYVESTLEKADCCAPKSFSRYEQKIFHDYEGKRGCAHKEELRLDVNYCELLPDIFNDGITKSVWKVEQGIAKWCLPFLWLAFLVFLIYKIR